MPPRFMLALTVRQRMWRAIAPQPTMRYDRYAVCFVCEWVTVGVNDDWIVVSGTCAELS